MKRGSVVGVLVLLATGIAAVRLRTPPMNQESNSLSVNDDLSALTTKLLAAALEQDGITVEARGLSLKLGSRTLSVTTSTDSVKETDGKVFVGLAFACTVDGKAVPALHTGSIGIDDTKQAAMHTATQEWVFQYGVPTAMAVMGGATDGGKADGAISVGDLVVFPGATGIRGQAPAEFRGLASFHNALISHLSSLLKPLASEGGLHAMTLTLVFKEGSPLQGECRLDGKVSVPLLTAAQEYPWPKVTGTFMVKQYYVFSAQAPK